MHGVLLRMGAGSRSLLYNARAKFEIEFLTRIQDEVERGDGIRADSA